MKICRSGSESRLWRDEKPDVMTATRPGRRVWEKIKPDLLSELANIYLADLSEKIVRQFGLVVGVGPGMGNEFAGGVAQCQFRPDTVFEIYPVGKVFSGGQYQFRFLEISGIEVDGSFSIRRIFGFDFIGGVFYIG